MKARWVVSFPTAIAILCNGGLAIAEPIENVRTEAEADWVSAGIGGVGGGSGQIELAGVSGPVRKAFLYWHGVDLSANGGDGDYDNETVSINGNAVTGQSLGEATTNCWGAGSSRAFVADVTEHVGGNGTYTISGLSAQAGHSANGASLVVVFDDGNPANDRDLVFFEGNDSNIPEGFPGEDDGWNATLSGINYGGGSVSIQLHVADGQDFSDGTLLISGVGNVTINDSPTLWDGNSVASAGTSRAGNGSLWDIHTFDVTAAFGAPGPQALSLAGQVGTNDCFGLVLLLMDLESGSAPPTATPLETESVTPTATATETAPVAATPTESVVPTSTPTETAPVGPTPTPLPLDEIELVSGPCTPVPADAPSGGPALDADGSTVAFFSSATNLVPNDTNQHRDVFVKERDTGVLERVSVSSTGAQGNAPSQLGNRGPAISADGQIVAFASLASNLVAGDTNGVSDIFVHDRATGITERASVGLGGAEANGGSFAPSISADGRFVAFHSLASNLVPDDTNGASDIFIYDRLTGTTERACGVQGNGYSVAPSISADGGFVAFSSAATNLVPGDTNGRLDIFVCERSTGLIERVSVATDGRQGDGDSILPAINGDGTVVAFKSSASTLVDDDFNRMDDVFARDRTTGITERISVNRKGGDANNKSFPPAISCDGRYVAFGSLASNLVAGDVNGTSDIFVRDREAGITRIVTHSGVQANSGVPDAPPAISCDGAVVAFVTDATNLGCPEIDFRSVFVAPNPFFAEPLMPSPTATAPPTETPTATESPTATASVTATASPSPTDTAPATFTPLPIATATGTETATAAPTASPTASATSEITSTPTPTASSTPSASATATETEIATATPTLEATETPTETASATPSATEVGTEAATVAPTATETTSEIPTATPASTDTPLPPSPTSTEAPSATPTATLIPTATPSEIPTATPSEIPTETGTPTETPSATDTPLSPSPTPTDTPPTGGAFVANDIAADATVIAVHDLGAFPARGVVRIGDELIRYNGVRSGDDGTTAGAGSETAAGELVILQRGVDGTEVAVHGSGSLIVLVRDESCTGDCDGARLVTVDKLVQGVTIALGTQSVDLCPAFDANADGSVMIDELVQGVSNALNGCAGDGG